MLGHIDKPDLFPAAQQPGRVPTAFGVEPFGCNAFYADNAEVYNLFRAATTFGESRFPAATARKIEDNGALVEEQRRAPCLLVEPYQPVVTKGESGRQHDSHK